MVVHNETSTGVTSRVGDIRAAMDKVGHPALLLVDTISSLGSVDFRHDEWKVDVTVSCSQKGLMLPPGLGFNAISEKASAAAKTNRMPRSYWDWEEMLKPNAAGFFPYTPATNLLYGLREAIAMLLEEGLDQVFARHKRLAAATRAAVHALGPRGAVSRTGRIFAGADRRADAARAMTPTSSARPCSTTTTCRSGSGLSKVAGKVFRIGHLGECNELTLIGALSGVEMGLAAAGVPHRAGGVDAAMTSLEGRNEANSPAHLKVVKTCSGSPRPWNAAKAGKSPAFLCIDGAPPGRGQARQIVIFERCKTKNYREGRQMTLHTGRHFLQIPGPTNVPDRVLRAMDMPTLDHRGVEFAELGHAVLAGCQRIFRTKQPVIIYPASGTGAWEAAIVNTLSPGDKVLMAETGQFAVLWLGIAEKFKLDVEFLPTDWRRGADVERDRGEACRRSRAQDQGRVRGAQRDLDQLRHPSARSSQGAQPHQPSGAADGRYHLRSRRAGIRARRLGHRYLRRRLAEGHDAAAGARASTRSRKRRWRPPRPTRRCGPTGTGTT